MHDPHDVPGTDFSRDSDAPDESLQQNEHLRQYLRQLEAIVDNTPDAIFVKDTGGRYRFVNEVAADYLNREPSDLVGATDEDLFGEETASEICRRERRVLDAETSETFEETLPLPDGDRVFETTRAPYYDSDGDLAGTVVVCQDVTEQKVRQRSLEDQRDELGTLNRINEVAREVIRTLIGEPTREEIEQAVCDRLVESELYRIAWIGEPDPTGSELAGMVSAGMDEETREVVGTIDMGEGSGEPAAKAYHEAEPQVVTEVASDETFALARRDALLDHGVRSGIAVPIRYGDTTYGVLAVGSDRLLAFSDRETDAFEVLGEVIGFAIGAVKHRRLALSDTVVELELRSTDRESFYIAVSEELGCTLELEGMATGPDGSLLFYDWVTGADHEALAEFAEDWDGVENIRLVSDRGDRSLFEFTMSGSSLVVTLSEYGAKTKAAITEDGEALIVAELPSDADVRDVVQRVQNRFPGVELVAKRDRERDVRTAREFRQELDDRLTEAQRTALRASYFAGYYEWPRHSTAEEIAESLGISSPTFHQHIRKAQDELLRAFFGRDRDRT